ncbi:DoxX family protein [Sandaracinus amylolyticus]|uniref:DoxX-like family protein n=1 Tax=Sandaracinus amylolyticus TaxID=927083 RepID=A0A0F6YMB7_9BACT|nr:DoxX family protein [Sandaracinus amylolyticus]AKF10088.1 hypothetical protein DB32_007237 [Sandaracinus amylolyticus]
MNALRPIAYWISTALLALALGAGGVLDLTRAPEVMTGLERLGYPAYLATLLGAWKLAGVAALLAPGLGRLKEWAYAGIAFDLTGAAFSHVASGDAPGAVAPIALFVIAAASWALRPASRLARPLPWSTGRVPALERRMA